MVLLAYTATYATSDISNMVIDVIGGLFNALAGNIGTIAVIIVVLIVLGLALDLFTGIFGIFNRLKRR